MDWRKAVAYITGTVDEELLLRREYLCRELDFDPATPRPLAPDLALSERLQRDLRAQVFFETR